MNKANDSSQKKANVAIIGCGRISGHHCKSILETEGAELIAVCDLDEGKANVYRDQYKTKAYTNYHKMLMENPEVNTVALITPSGMHYEHALEILEKYNVNLVVEKPTFMKPSHFDKVFEVVKRKGLSIFPVFQNRHNLAVQRVKKGLLSRELGKIRIVSVRVRWCRPQNYYDLAAWRGTFSMDGGCLTNQGIHHIDLMRYFGGEVNEVCSKMKTMGSSIEVEDVAVASVLFNNGTLGSVEVTTAARPIDFEASLSIVCENGLAQIGGIAVNELQIYTPDPSTCSLNSEDFSGNVYGKGHGKLYQEIVNFYRKNEDFSISYEDAKSTIQLLNAFYVADEKESWVKVDESGESIRLGTTNEKLSNLYRTPDFVY
ncbi:Gfo/Idh/MocA family protein [Leptospira borgpetersenii]|uniref:Gfo/Idh/MocA family protein n=1 Tax=Leptospira borgpetersenii TaxID=174 RepID=UPI0002986250|nr:Gfo/Idh/MocA family oxidoreductase [Leptospira borgpetersenii]EKR00614.1 oxidoreductase, NAD-binding domain protein [Leptospira borgpetersenii serovar Castellonis str. 200801910]KGE24378.1 dehydrogenase [Leptospira borgpetersenii serovar Ballum]MBE8159766.1 Gfo/Idh/MocA family oxidoreductase [Leptospira borgpetersenii serovar Ballum]MBE8164212.1 Gfo/Idh/MocA family oxidoreductase [Leptospira borgpetersenii serovar Ballum]MBE8169482.1 Gfo/Idh/MocA family oxidoreductase [Leptospira borgpeters